MYFPLANKADFYRLTQQIYKVNEFEDIKESHLVNSCFRFRRDATGNVLTMFGYNDKNFEKVLIPSILEQKTFYFPPTFLPSKNFYYYYFTLTCNNNNLHIGYGGRIYISLSDNKSFTLFVLCHDDGLGSFVVTSPHKTLPEETLNIIKEHVKALGFKKEYFIQPNYELDNCESPVGKDEELPVPKNFTIPRFLANLLAFPTRRYSSNAVFNF
jgi:hypothetical protein